jgi:hypothetical protein
VNSALAAHRFSHPTHSLTPLIPHSLTRFIPHPLTPFIPHPLTPSSHTPSPPHPTLPRPIKVGSFKSSATKFQSVSKKHFGWNELDEVMRLYMQSYPFAHSPLLLLIGR